MAVYRRYRRVSRREQAQNSNAFEQQLFHLNEQLESLGVPLDESPLYEDQQSGKEDNRPGFQRMLDELDRGDWIVVTRIDRIARHTEFNAKLAKIFVRLNVQFFEIDRGRALDWENDNDYEYFLNAGIKAEMESRRISSRVKRGKRYARAQGKANSMVPFGYQRVEEKYRIDLELQDFALARIALLENTGSYAAAVRVIKKMPDLYGGTVTVEGLRRWFHNPALRGHTGYQEDYTSRHLKKRQGKAQEDLHFRRKTDESGMMSSHNQIVWDTHSGKNDTPDERLLTDERYQAICRKLKYKGSAPGNQERNLTPLSGLLRCGACSGPMAITRNSRTQKPYYTCLSAKRRLAAVPCGQKACIPLEIAERFVIEQIRNKAGEIAQRTAEELTQATKEIDPRLNELQRSLAQLNALPQNPALETAKDALRQQIQAIKNESRPTVKAASREAIELFDLIADSVVDAQYWESLSAATRRQLFHGLINRVVVTAMPPGRFSSAKWDWVVVVTFAF